MIVCGVHVVIVSHIAMKIGIPKEIKNNEYRVALVVAGVKALVAKGHHVVVQAGAGLGSGIPDGHYSGAGAQIVDSAAEAWEADLVVKVKEPQESEFQYLRPGLILYTYLHLAAEPRLTAELLEKKVRAVAYETIQLADRSLPLLRPMSEVAGRMAPQVGAHMLQKENGGSGVLLGGVTGVARGDVTIVGGGVAGLTLRKWRLA